MLPCLLSTTCVGHFRFFFFRDWPSPAEVLVFVRDSLAFLLVLVFHWQDGQESFKWFKLRANVTSTKPPSVYFRSLFLFRLESVSTMRFSRTLWISSILASCALSAAETEPGDAPTSQVSGGHNDQNTKQGASTIATASGSGDDSSAAAQSESNEEEASSDGLGEGRRIARVVISSPDGEVEGEASVAWKADEGTTIQLDLSKGLVDTDEAQYKWHFHQKPV